MIKRKSKSPQLPLAQALAWIFGSVLVITGPSYAAFKHYLKKQSSLANNPSYLIRSIVQTGPQRGALKTDVLAEILGLSADHPSHGMHFDVRKARQSLLRFPLISQAELRWIKPNTLYVDYTVRQPVAWLEDFENVAIDKEGYPFPFAPFFTPKNLPAFYLGAAPFGSPAPEGDRPSVQWGEPLSGKCFDIAMHILSIVSDPQVEDLFHVKRIDVSNAFAESYGTREIVLITEDSLVHTSRGKPFTFHIPRILRLSTKNYAQELGNYLPLRAQLLDEERREIEKNEQMPTRFKERVIDFRIPKLAFVEEIKSNA